jgi:hypothetical protein
VESEKESREEEEGGQPDDGTDVEENLHRGVPCFTGIAYDSTVVHSGTALKGFPGASEKGKQETAGTFTGRAREGRRIRPKWARSAAGTEVATWVAQNYTAATAGSTTGHDLSG